MTILVSKKNIPSLLLIFLSVVIIVSLYSEINKIICTLNHDEFVPLSQLEICTDNNELDDFDVLLLAKDSASGSSGLPAHFYSSSIKYLRSQIYFISSLDPSKEALLSKLKPYLTYCQLVIYDPNPS